MQLLANHGRALLLTAMLLAPATTLAQTATQVIEYYHTDALGSVRAVTKQINGQWTVVVRHDFMPFGEEVAPPTPPQDKRLFTGKERDNETGLDYFEASYTRASAGRFSTVDPELNINAALLDPQRWNRYAYVRNNPLRYIDPDGRDIWDLFAGMGNAIKSNFTLGVGRETGGNTDFRVGQFAGDLISIPVGLAETVTGGGASLTGLAAEGPSFGTSTVVVAGGVMVMTQGGTAAIAGAAGAGTFLAESANSLSGGRSGGLSNAEAREQARDLGFKATKDAPVNSHGKPVFQKGDFFITPDRDSHKGGVWKVFDRKGNRIGTYNADLTEKIGQ